MSVSKEKTGDDYADFMEKAQAKFKERNEILQNVTPSTKERLLTSSLNVEVQSSSDLVNEPKKPTVIEFSTYKDKPLCGTSKGVETAKQSVKENIRKFENTPSQSSKGIETVKQSVKDNIRKFEQIANTNTPSPSKSVKKFGHVANTSKSSPLPAQNITMKIFEQISTPDTTRFSPAKPFNDQAVSPERKIEKEDSPNELLSPPPKKGKEVELSSVNSPVKTPVSFHEGYSYSPEKFSLDAEIPPSPVTLFDKRLRSTMEPMTPKRARLMDEINEDYQKHSNSLPRRQPSQVMDFNESGEDSALVSLKEYRQGTMDKRPTDMYVEKLTYKSLQSVDSTDSGTSKQKVDRIRQLEEFINVCQTQYEQAKKALSLTISKPERGEEEFIAANHILLNHRVVLEAALRMRRSLDKKKIVKVPEMRASFTFHSVEFELDSEFLHNMCTDKFSCYFTVVIGHNETTRCSPHISAREHKKCRMSVDIYCAINDVEPGFEIFVEVYMLKVQKSLPEKKSTFVDTVGTLLRGDRQTPRKDEFQRSSPPHFERIGTAIINNTNMRSRHIPANTIDPLAPRFVVHFDHRVIENNHQMEGYLRRYEVVAGVGNWAMEYMAFDKWFLDSWVTQRDKLEEKPSIRSISLRRCLDVGEVSDSACYPHAFYITYSLEEGQEEKLLLAARSKAEQEQWLKVLKNFVEGLKYWS